VNRKKWFFSLVFLIFSFVLMANIAILTVYFFAKIYLYFFQDVPFFTYLPGLYKVIRAASFGGFVAGVDCWFAYYRYER